MRLLVLVNLHASRAEQGLGGALTSLIANGFDLDIRSPADRHSSAKLIGALGPSVDAIVVAGGDGTLNGLLSALIDQGKPVGVLPMGTANDLARTLNVPFDPVAAAAIIAAGNKRRVDVGRVNDSYFLNVASIGLSVQIAERQTELQKKQLGILSYAVAALGTLSEAERFEATIELPGYQAGVHAYQIAVGNGVHFGGGMKVSPEAVIDDGLLDIYAIETATIPDLITLAPQLRSGTLVERTDVAYFRSEEALITTIEPMPVNTDGELTTETPATFSVLRSALEFFAP